MDFLCIRKSLAIHGFLSEDSYDSRCISDGALQFMHTEKESVALKEDERKRRCRQHGLKFPPKLHLKVK